MRPAVPDRSAPPPAQSRAVAPGRAEFHRSRDSRWWCGRESTARWANPAGRRRADRCCSSGQPLPSLGAVLGRDRPYLAGVLERERIALKRPRRLGTGAPIPGLAAYVCHVEELAALGGRLAECVGGHGDP